MWPFTRKAATKEADQDLERRVRDLERALEEVEADVAWLSGDLKKLRGRVTGGVRKTAEDAPGSTNGEAEPPRFSPAWFKARGVHRG